MGEEIKDILDRAEEILRTAELGLLDMSDDKRRRRLPGLRNVIVFGRSVTWVLQNLNGKQAGFEEWYLEKQGQMAADPVFKYFKDARNKLEKQGRLSVSTSSHIHSFSSADMAKFGPPPPGAKTFFIGDQLGGAGWEVELPDGERIKYYVNLPEEIGTISQHFSDTSEDHFPELMGRNVDDLANEYLNKLGTILDEARKQFLGEPAPSRLDGFRLPPYLRVIK